MYLLFYHFQVSEQRNYLQSELEKERETKEKFRIAAEELEAVSKHLQEEFNIMKEEVEVKTIGKLVDLQSKLNSHRNELENTISQLIPGSKVRDSSIAIGVLCTR